jgi:hypothetical protein
VRQGAGAPAGSECYFCAIPCGDESPNDRSIKRLEVMIAGQRIEFGDVGVLLDFKPSLLQVGGRLRHEMQ